MNIKKGDKVIMLTGKDRGKDGKVLAVHEGRVTVEGLNLIKRHQRARKQGQQGQILTKERSVDASNVQVLCPKCGAPTRIAYKILEHDKIRVCKKCNAEL